MESLDLVVVGTGWSGLAAVKTFVEINPASKVALLEAASTVGGVWAKHRLYKGLKSNNMLGTYEFSDFPMDERRFGVHPGEHIPGHVVQAYLEAYADHFHFADRIRLDTRVRSAERRADGSWLLTASRSGGSSGGDRPDDDAQIETKKLILATGITSEPFVPEFAGQDSFSAPLFHSRDLRQHEGKTLQAQKRIAVFGGTKSAWDAVYASATAQMQVDWIIRESGHGPAWMAPAYVTPLKKWLEKLVTTRLLTWFSPCVWGDADGFGVVRRLLHCTRLGRWLVDAFWGVLASDVLALNAYDAHPETRKLKPWTSPFWVASSLSILNYPTPFFDLVRSGAVRVHIADIASLSPNTIHLSSGARIPTSALVCSTGWKATPNIAFRPAGLDRSLGLPCADDCADRTLVQRADDEILRRFPRLRAQPQPQPQPQPGTRYRPPSSSAEAAAPHPFRLYRFMVPTAYAEDRSIAFLGVTMTINTALVAQTQALWVSAYMSGKLTPTPSPPPASLFDGQEEINIPAQSSLALEWETALHSEFGRFRYPAGFGRRNPDFVFDALPYVDLLLRDLGVDAVRKRALWKRCFVPYGMEDYRGLVAEWLDGAEE